jgi:hypothetical protein
MQNQYNKPVTAMQQLYNQSRTILKEQIKKLMKIIAHIHPSPVDPAKRNDGSGIKS